METSRSLMANAMFFFFFPLILPEVMLYTYQRDKEEEEGKSIPLTEHGHATLLSPLFLCPIGILGVCTHMRSVFLSL